MTWELIYELGDDVCEACNSIANLSWSLYPFMKFVCSKIDDSYKMSHMLERYQKRELDELHRSLPEDEGKGEKNEASEHVSKREEWRKKCTPKKAASQWEGEPEPPQLQTKPSCWYCACKIFILASCCVGLLLTTLFLVVFFLLYPKLIPSEISPSRIISNNVIAVNFGDTQKWMSSLDIKIMDCDNAKTLVSHRENCSLLKSNRSLEYENWQGLQPMYFLKGSNLDIRLNSSNHTVVVLKSLDAWQGYENISSNLCNDSSHTDSSCTSALSLLCDHLESLPLQLLFNKTYWCYDADVVSYQIKESDFYVIIAPVQPLITGTVYYYNSSLISNMGAETHYSNMPIFGSFPFSQSEDNCVLCWCKEDCDGQCAIHDVRYTIHRGYGMMVFPAAGALLLVIVLCFSLLRICCGFSRESKGRYTPLRPQ